MNKLKLFPVIFFIVTAQLAGVVGGLSVASSVGGWYKTIIKPNFTPPDYVFAPVWTALYLLMGIAAFLVYNQGINKKEVRGALCLYFVQIILNALWSFLFFGLKSPLLGLADIVALWILIILTIIYFYRVSKPAAFIMLPYLAWVSFAFVLNYEIFRLNS